MSMHTTSLTPTDLGHNSHESVGEMYPSSRAGSSGVVGVWWKRVE